MQCIHCMACTFIVKQPLEAWTQQQLLIFIYIILQPKITTEGGRNGLRCDTTTSPRRSTRSMENNESKTFLKQLYAFMKSNRTPIGRIPQCGYKERECYNYCESVCRVCYVFLNCSWFVRVLHKSTKTWWLWCGGEWTTVEINFRWSQRESQ